MEQQVSAEPQVFEITPADSGVTPQSDGLQLPDSQAPESEASKIDASLQKAFDKAKADADTKPKPEAKAEAKPEEKAEDKPAEEKEAKAEKPAAQRAPDGKFQSAKPVEEAATAEEAPKRETAYREAPQRFDAASKSEWESVPESVRGNIHRMERELSDGLAKYREAAESYESVREFDHLARQNGGNLRASLEKVVSIEQAFLRNPMEGMQRVADHFGINLRQLAAAISGQPADQAQAQNENTISQLRRTVAELQQQIGGVTQHMRAQQQSAQVASAQSEWEGFARENPRAEELEGEIASILQRYPATGLSQRERLADAYAIAVARNPATAHTGAVVEQAQTLPIEPRAAKPEGQKSIAGAPSAGTLTQSGRKKAAPPSIDDALQSALNKLSRI